jgi:hypothetical protein
MGIPEHGGCVTISVGGVAPLLVAAFLGSGGGHMAVAHHTIELGAAQSRSIQDSGRQRAADARASAKPAPTTSPSPSPSPSPSLSPSAVTGAVLRQGGSQQWTATVLLNDNSPGCKGKASYWLETTSPDKTIPASTVTAVKPATNPATGSSCEVTVVFTGPGQVPETAALIINQAGASSAIPLTVSRDVTLYYYLGIPAIAGGVMALVGFLISMLYVRIYRPGGDRIKFCEPGFWEHPLTASGAWALNDSWATNITTGLVVVGTVLTTATAASSLFPGVALDRFAIVNIIVGGIVVAAPLVFAILYARWTRKDPGVTPDASLTLPSDADVPPDHKTATITVPAGATIMMPGGATVDALDNGDWPPISVKVGGVIQVPPGSDIRVEAGSVMSLPATTSDITVRPGGVLTRREGADGAWAIAADQVTPPAQKPPPQQLRVHLKQLLVQLQQPKAPDLQITYPATVTVPDGAKISVVGVADVKLPQNTTIRPPITAPRSQQAHPLPRDRVLQVPAGPGMIVANMKIVLIAAVVTMFGMGAELGIAGVLSYGLSEANQGWRLAMLGATVLVAIFVLWYSVTAIGALADPQPGSSLSAEPGTSFTL